MPFEQEIAFGPDVKLAVLKRLYKRGVLPGDNLYDYDKPTRDAILSVMTHDDKNDDDQSE